MRLFLLLAVVSTVVADKFQVLRTANISFPTSNVFAARLNASYHTSIPECTICLRFLVFSYYEGLQFLYMVSDGILTERFSYNAEMTSEFQGGLTAFNRKNVPGGGLGGVSYPVYHNFEWPKTIEIDKWYHYCWAYSSITHKINAYQDGFRVYTFKYPDDVEDPLSENIFEKVEVLRNFLGLMTDFNIYSSYFTDEQMIDWTAGCKDTPGDIFDWDPNKLILTKEKNFQIETDILEIARKEICFDPSRPIPPLKPIATATTVNQAKPDLEIKMNSYKDSVLVYIGDPSWHTNRDAIDRCQRLTGELTSLPQNEDEEKMMDKLILDYYLKVSGLNESSIPLAFSVKVIGETLLLNEDTTNKKLKELEEREQTYPKNGEMELFHPLTGARLKMYRPGIVMPQSRSYYKYPLQCLVCFHSRKLKEGQRGDWNEDGAFTCVDYPGKSKRHYEGYICAFPTEPSFTVRGLCEDAVMDTEFKFAAISPIPGGCDFPNCNIYRSFVGPKGWIISYDKEEKVWKMSHHFYTKLTLTMLDPDVMPVGRHTWRVENNVCNQGNTNDIMLQISGCGDRDFTCDDGKCVKIDQRCNNIEVS